MRLLTNPGSNLPPELIERYNILVLPQHIVVDGLVHDTRRAFGHDEVDRWTKTAKKWPETIGTTAAESVGGFQQALRDGDREMLVLTTSKKVINSYQSAERGVRTFTESPQGKDCRIVLVDTGVTDVGALIACVIAGEAKKAGKDLDEVKAIVEAACADACLMFSVATLENMVKGGRASFLRAFIAGVLGVGPVLGFVDGALQLVGKHKRRLDMATQLVEHLKTRVAPGRKVWAGIHHTGDSGVVATLKSELQKTWDVQALFVRPTAAGVYLHAGPGHVGAALVPVDRLPWTPPPLLA